MPLKGVDISEMNDSVDFNKLKAAGVRFVIIRCGYGSDYPGQQDTEFEANVRKAEAAGIPWGVYHFGYARDTAGGRAEAAHALRLIGNRNPAYGVWYDMEADSTLGGDLGGAADAFCSTVEKAGFYCGVYASLNWWENYLTDPVFNKYDCWCAQYNSECELRKPYGIWQHTDRWTIDGKAFDGNWAYKDYPALTGTKKNADTKQKGENDVPTYKQLKDVPASYRPTIRKLMEKGALSGREDPDPNSLEDNILDVDEIYCRVMTTLDRLGVLDGQGQNTAAPGA